MKISAGIADDSPAAGAPESPGQGDQGRDPEP
jgi:hypothetical protein